MHKIATAKKLVELATPTINKILDEGVSERTERELDGVMKIVELAHYLCEMEMMEDKMYPHDDEMSAGSRRRTQ